MKMGKKISILVLCVVLALIVGFGIRQIVCLNQVTFDGSRVKNPDSYTIEFTRMNMVDEHVMILKAGDELAVDFSIEKGTVNLLIGKEDEPSIYKGNGIDEGSFVITVPADGAYHISVEAKGGAGYVHINAPALSE